MVICLVVSFKTCTNLASKNSDLCFTQGSFLLKVRSKKEVILNELGSLTHRIRIFKRFWPWCYKGFWQTWQSCVLKRIPTLPGYLFKVLMWNLCEGNPNLISTYQPEIFSSQLSRGAKARDWTKVQFVGTSVETRCGVEKRRRIVEIDGKPLKLVVGAVGNPFNDVVVCPLQNGLENQATTR